MTDNLLKISEVAARLGVGVKPLARTAADHGFLIRIGASSRIRESEIEGLIEKCRCQPKVRACSSDDAQDVKPSMSSKTPVVSNKARAQGIAAKLKSRSQTTSPERTAEVVRLGRKK